MSWTAIVAAVLGIVRVVESVMQWYNTQQNKDAIASLWAIIKNIFTLETYKKV